MQIIWGGADEQEDAILRGQTAPLSPKEEVKSSPRGFVLDHTAMHLCIGMQRMFAEPTSWQVLWLPRILPAVLEIARRHAHRTLFTRFMPPRVAAQAAGAWRQYYEKWPEMTRERMDPRLLDLVEPPADLVPPARMIDKVTNSVFGRPRLARGLKARGTTTLIITGGETDVCVLATVMSAIDHDFRIVLPADALF